MDAKKLLDTVNAAKMRETANNMTKAEMVEQRDFMENNWAEVMRPSMLVLSRASLSKFNTPLSQLEA